MKELNLKQWHHHLMVDKITTNSRWLSNLNEKPIFGHFLIPNRPELNIPKSDHHGIWIPEIPYQMLMRFTKEHDNIWSQFGGSGTDYYVAKYLNRNCYINDLNSNLDFIDKADTRSYKLPEKVQMILSHPPYWDMVTYSKNENDGSTKKNLNDFLVWWNEILDNSVHQLKDKGYFILACGNLYKNGEEIELGEILKNMVLKRGFILKQHIIKDYGETKGTEAKNYNLNYYRQLKGGYGNFYGDNIFVLKKEKSKNNLNKLYKFYRTNNSI